MMKGLGEAFGGDADVAVSSLQALFCLTDIQVASRSKHQRGIWRFRTVHIVHIYVDSRESGWL
jgi:hypothetical protein